MTMQELLVRNIGDKPIQANEIAVVKGVSEIYGREVIDVERAPEGTKWREEAKEAEPVA